MLLTQLNVFGIQPFAPIFEQTSANASGDFRDESAMPKGKTWIITITCRTANGGEQTYGGTNEIQVPNLVAAAIAQKNLNFTPPRYPLVSSEGGSYTGGQWVVGSPETTTLNAVCKILGSPTDTYSSFTCRDGERTAKYPNGKCNNDTPQNNSMSRFVGTFSIPQCQDGIDNDGDGAIDLQDFSCQNNPNGNDETNPKAQCQDGIDNDGDGKIDSADPRCHTDGNPHNPASYNKQDNDEGPPDTQCNDGLDNDGDGAIDLADFSCQNNPNGNNETNPKSQCQDGIDNDGDGKTDGADPRCHTDNNANNPASYDKQRNDESPKDTQCNDGIDNDGDGAIDLQDFSCQNDPNNNDETNPKAQCQDGIDNDGDGKTDGADPRCHTDNNPANPNSLNKQDNDEGPADTQCNDGIDNDGDGAVDLADFSCQNNPNGNNETNPKAQCQDGLDNDGDGLIDSQDPGCTDPQDNTENSEPAPAVDLKINGQDSTVNVPVGTAVTLSWTSTGVQRCNTGNSNLPGWGQNQPLQVSGSAQVTASQNGTYHIQCSKTLTSNFVAQDSVAVTVIQKSQCNDGIDNDGDGAIDLQDFSCQNNPNNNDEANPKAQCQDGLDNDGDGKIDSADPRCHTDNNAANPNSYNKQDNDESPADITTQCNDGIDNDGDGATDLQDFSCQNNPNSNNETNPKAQCQDGLDNDGDGFIDSQDPGCTNAQDNDEGPFNSPPVKLTNVAVNNCSVTVNYTKQFSACAHLVIANGSSKLHVQNLFCNQSGPVTTQLSNFLPPFAPGLSVKLCDGNNESSCSSPVTVSGGGTCSPVTQCNDGIDNDGDGAIDLADFSCQNNPNKTDETNPKAQCQDGIDNDGDGKIDAADPRCHTDNNPNNPASYNKQDNDESPADITTQCNDGIDNDGDGTTDSQDSGCSGPTDTNEGDGPADVQVTMVGPSTVQNGQNASYVVTVRNNGPDAVTTPFTMRDIVPSGFVYQSQLSSPGCSQNGADIICSGITLGINQSRDFNLVFSVSVQTAFEPNFFQRLIGLKAVLAASCGQSVTNTAIVHPGQPDPNNANNTASVVTQITCPQQTADVSITKSGPVSINNDAAQHFNYSLIVANNGPGSASNVVVSDNIPQGLSITSVPQGCTSNGNFVSCSLGTLATNTPRTLSIGVSVPARSPYCNQTMTNTASVTTTTADANQQNNQSSAQTNVICSALQTDISMTKSAPATLTNDVAASFNYTLNVINNSGVSAANVIVTDTVPQPLVITSVPSGCSSNGNTITCSASTLAGSESRQYIIGVSAPARSVCAQTVTNTAYATTTTQETNPHNNQGAVQTNFTCSNQNARLYITKDGPATVNAGGTITYSFTLQNTSAFTAPDVKVSDYFIDSSSNQIPSPLTFVSSSGLPCSFNAQTSKVSCAAGDMTAHQFISFTMTFQTPAHAPQLCSQSIINRGEAMSSYNTATLDADTATTTFICPTAQFSATKTADVQTVKPGEFIVYTIVTTNNGPTTQQDIRVVDAVPGNLLFVPTGSTAGCSQVGAAIFCPSLSYNASQSQNTVLKFQVNPSAQCGGNIVVDNVAGIQQNNAQIAQSNHATTPVQCVPTSADLQVTLIGPPVASPGQNVTYVATVKNNGPSAATTPFTLKDAIPDSFIFVPTGSTPGCIQSGTEIVCSGITLTVGEQRDFTFIYNVPQTISMKPNFFQKMIGLKTVLAAASCGSSVTNVATVFPSQTDPNSANNTASVVTLIQCQAPQFAATKLGPTNISPGEVATYLVNVTNTGNSTQSNIQMYDDVPTGLTFVPAGSTAGCSVTGNRVTCLPQTYTQGQSASFTLKFMAQQNIVCNSHVLNQAFVTKNSVIVTQSNQTSTAVQCTIPRLDITKSAPPTVNAGGTITYNFTLRNTSTTQTATQVELYDFNIDAQANPITPYFTFASISLGSCDPVDTQGRIHCNLPNLAPSQTVNFTMTFTVPSNQNICNKTVINQVDVWTQNDINNADWDKAQTVVLCQSQNADISVVKTGPSSVPFGSNAVYSFAVNNVGPATATNVVLHETIPPLMTYVSATGATCAQVPNTPQVNCQIGSVTTGNPVNVQMTFGTNAPPQDCVPATVPNTANLTSSSVDPHMANNTSSVQTTLTCPVNNTADVSIVKSATTQSVVRGGSLTYNVLVSNAGPAPAANVTFVDQIPAGMTFVTNTGNATCTPTASQVSCVLGTMNSGTSQTVSLAFEVTPQVPVCTPGTVLNRVGVTSSTTDPNAGNNTSSVVTPVTCPAELAADMAVYKFGPPTTVRGQNITYSFLAVNVGPDTAHNIVISDPIPAGLTFVSSSGGTCSVVGNVFQCTVASLPSGQSTQLISVTFAVPTIQNCTAGSITNTATITASTLDPIATNNTSTIQTPVTCPSNDSDLAIVKTGPATAIRGQNITYSLTVTNNGTSANPTTYTVTDPVPSGMTFVPTGSSANCSLQGANVVCTGSLGFGPGPQSTQLSLVFNLTTLASCTQTTATNTVTVTGSNPDPVSTNNSSTATTTVTCPSVTSDIAVTKTGPSSVVRGATLSYTITAVNNGPNSATNVIVSDSFSSEFTYSSASGATCSANGNVLTCSLGSMTSGQSTPITVIFTVRNTSGTCSATTVTNTATITSDTADSNTANNTSSAVSTQLTCSGTGEISVYKTDNRSTANVGDRLRYSIILTNNNSTAVSSLLVTDNMPFGLTVLTVSDGGTVSAQQVRWTDISVPANSSRTLYVDTEVRSDVGNGTIINNTVDVNGRTASDQTTIYNNTYVNPPPPPYYNPPPPYYNPPPPYYNPPPPYYNNPPPAYYNPPPPYVNPPPPYVNPPSVVYPQTGDTAVDLFGAKNDASNITPVNPATPKNDNGFSAVFYATLLAFFAVGSAAASRFVGLGL